MDTITQKLILDNDKLRKALIGLVGVEAKDDLIRMEVLINLLPEPEPGIRVMTINAIHALLETMP